VGFLFKKNKIDSIIGSGRIVSANSVEVKSADGKVTTLNAKRILIATGSAPIELNGLKFDGQFIVDSTGGLAFKEVPKKLLIVGGGYIGVEMGSIWKRLGSEVLTIEFTDRILPLMDQELSGMLQRSLEKSGMKFKFNSAAMGAEIKNGKVSVTVKTGEQTTVEECDRVLVCTGRKPVTDGLGLAEIGVAMDERGFILANPHFETSVSGVLRHRRRDRRDDAGAQGGRGRNRLRRIDGRQSGPCELQGCAGRGVHASGICPGGIDRGRGEGAGA